MSAPHAISRGKAPPVDLQAAANHLGVSLEVLLKAASDRVRRDRQKRTSDHLGRVYTPDWLAEECVRLASLVMTCPPELAVDPGVGGGALLRAARRPWPAATLAGWDLDDRAQGLTLCAWRGRDWLSPEPHLLERDWSRAAVVTNPPYHRDGRHWLHIERALALRPACVVAILPLAHIGQGSAERCLDGDWRPETIPVKGRVWQCLREVVVLVWSRAGLKTGASRILRPKGIRAMPNEAVAPPPQVDPRAAWLERRRARAA